VVLGSMFVELTFARGWGNSWVGDQGIVNIKCNGIPSFSAQWM
jgi:hypothetical protein